MTQALIALFWVLCGVFVWGDALVSALAPRVLPVLYRRSGRGTPVVEVRHDAVGLLPSPDPFDDARVVPWGAQVRVTAADGAPPTGVTQRLRAPEARFALLVVGVLAAAPVLLVGAMVAYLSLGLGEQGVLSAFSPSWRAAVLSPLIAALLLAADLTQWILHGHSATFGGEGRVGGV